MLLDYLLTRYPIGIDPSFSKEIDGVYSARRFYQNGKSINRIVVTWSLQEPPLSSVSFSFFSCLPPYEFRWLENDKPFCYKCWGIGHILRYCSAPKKYAFSSESHHSRTCPHHALQSSPSDTRTLIQRADPPTCQSYHPLAMLTLPWAGCQCIAVLDVRLRPLHSLWGHHHHRLFSPTSTHHRTTPLCPFHRKFNPFVLLWRDW